MTILVLTLLRLAWRLTHRPPAAVEGGIGGFLAKAVHTLLYVFMIGAPLTGARSTARTARGHSSVFRSPFRSQSGRVRLRRAARS